MSQELRIAYDTGATLTAVVLNLASGVPQTVTLSESLTGHYVGDLPTLDAGRYDVTYCDGTSPIGTESWGSDGTRSFLMAGVTYSLGCTSTYNGTTLKLSLWAEVNGTPIVASQLAAARLLAEDGTPMEGVTWTTNTSQVNGVFAFSKAVTLAPATQIMFDCVATIAGVAVPLRIGLARP